MDIYDAAEYLVNAISRSPDFRITYDGLKMQLQQYNQAVAAFFNTETNYDFIFSKFPEIFIFKNDMISLTDGYLSMYRHEKPSKSFSSCGLAPDMENCAILYFLKILSLRGPQQYLNLFNMLKNDGTQMFADYFRNYSDLDMFNFFASNKEYFFLSSGIVRASPSILDTLYRKGDNDKWKLNEYVCFLLKCFGSLHYFELSKCICYGANCCKTFLKQFSLLKQREHFENLPDIAMNKYGFLSLKNNRDSTSFPLKHKMKLLCVCILAFKKKMHFNDLINEAIVKSKESVLFFHRMSKKNQRGFFKKLGFYFKVSADGFVKLLPSFTLPKCSFEDLTSDDIKQVSPELNLNNVKVNALNESVTSNLSDITSNEKHKEKKIKVEMNVVSSVHPELNKIQNNSPNETLASYQSHITSDEEPYQSDITSDEEPYHSDITSDEEPKKKKMKVEKNISSVHPKLNKIQNNSSETLIDITSNRKERGEKKRKKRKADAFNKQVCFVLKCLKSMHYFELRECLFYADNKSKNFLIQFSGVEPQEYFENIPNTVMDQNGFLHLKNEFVKIPVTNDREEHKMMIVLTVCILALKKKMHFKDLVNEVIEKSNKRCKLFQSTESQLQYFKRYTSMFVVSSDGFVQLLPTFMLRKCSFEELSTAFKNSKQNVRSMPLESSLPSKNLTAKPMTKNNDGACVKVESHLPQYEFDLSKNDVDISTADQNLTAKPMTKNNDGACVKVESHLPQYEFDFSKDDVDISTADQNSVSCKKPSSRSWFNAISF